MGQQSVDAKQNIRRELQRVIKSPDFQASERNRRFLTYVVEETLAGRASRIKAYSVATQVFGRGDDFDPLQDSIVRIEASRLRRELEHFYLKQPGTSGIEISIPKGGYVPAFQTRDHPAPDTGPQAPVQPQTEPRQLREPRLLVEQFELEGDTGILPGIAQILTRQTLSALIRFPAIFVYGIETTDRIGGASGGAAIAERLPADYRLFGAVSLGRETLNVNMLLQKIEDGRYIWSYDMQKPLGPGFEPGHAIALCNEIAGLAAARIAERDGIMDTQARDYAGDAPQCFGGYQTLLDFHDYWRTLDPQRFKPVLRDLEAAVAREPNFAAGYACLSKLYSNAARFGYDVSDTCSAALERAGDLARRAIRLAPCSSQAHHAKAICEWYSGQPDLCLETLETARSLNPNESEIIAEIGLRRAMRMDWDAAIPLLEEAYARNPLLPGSYRLGLFLYQFFEGHFEEAFRQAHSTNAPGVAKVQIAEAAALSGMGRFEEARSHLRLAEQSWRGPNGRLREDLAFRLLHGELASAIMASIGRADPRWRLSGADRERGSA